MRHRQSWAFAVLTVAALALAYLAGTVTPGHAKAADPAPARTSAWPPRAADIVNVTAPKGEITKGERGDVRMVVYEVPAGRSLVVTDVMTDGGAIGLWQRLGDVTAGKLAVRGSEGRPTSYSSPVGIVFAGGSKVLAGDPGFYFHLTGYLAEP